MAAPDTFSLATTGLNANSVFTAKPITVGDVGAGTNGAQANAMANNKQVYCKGPDGSLKWYTIDSERSRPGGPLYLLAVGP